MLSECIQLEGEAPMPTLTSLHFVKLPVTDLLRNRAWWTEMFGWRHGLDQSDGAGYGRLVTTHPSDPAADFHHFSWRRGVPGSFSRPEQRR